MTNKSKKGFHYAWVVLLGVAIMMGFARGGLNNATGLFLTPVSDDLGMSLSSLSLYVSIMSIVTMIFLPFAGKLIAKADIRIILIIGVIFHAGAFASMGYMNSVWEWYLLAIPCAIGYVIVAQIAGPVIINNWFKKSKGLALGIMMATVGAFGAFISPWIGNLISNDGWRSAYTTSGLSLGVGAIVVIILFIRFAPGKKGAYGADEVAEETTSNDTNMGIASSIAKKSPAFFALLAFFFFLTSVAAFAQHVPTFAITKGFDTAFGGTLMGLFMVGLLIGSLTFGFLADKIGAKGTTFVALISGLVTFVLFLFFGEVKLIIMIAAIIFGFLSSSIGTLGPLLTIALFGNKNYADIYATASVGLAVAGIVALPLYSLIKDLTNSYTIVLIAIIVMLIISMLLITLAFKQKEKLVKQGHWN
jgi:MFS family permease